MAGHTLVVFAGNCAGTALGFLANILIMRSLGPDGFGVVVVATTFLSVLWQLTGRGLDQALVRCVALFRPSEPGKADAACQTVYGIKLVLGGMLVLAGLAVSGPVTRFFVGPQASPVPLYVASVGALAASIWGYAGACLQANQSFWGYTLVQVANAAGRLVLVAALLAWGIMSPGLAMGAAAAGYLLAAVLGQVLSPAATRGWRGRAELRPTVYVFSRWLVVSSIIYLLYTRLDQLMLSRMAGPDTAGVYGAAVTFVQLVDLLTASLLTVFLPGICRETDTASLRRRAWDSLRVCLMLALPLIPAVFVARPVMGWLLGPRFGLSIFLFTIIFPGAIVNMITHPMQVILHARGKTHWLTGLDVAVLLANGVANYFAIRFYGAPGAAVVALLTRLSSGGLLALIVAYELRQGGTVREVARP